MLYPALRGYFGLGARAPARCALFASSIQHPNPEVLLRQLQHLQENTNTGFPNVSPSPRLCDRFRFRRPAARFFYPRARARSLDSFHEYSCLPSAGGRELRRADHFAVGVLGRGRLSRSYRHHRVERRSPTAATATGGRGRHGGWHTGWLWRRRGQPEPRLRCQHQGRVLVRHQVIRQL